MINGVIMRIVLNFYELLSSQRHGSLQANLVADAKQIF
jgi:hypothetical protein